MADNEIQKMIDDMKISIFNLENSYNQQKKQIDAVKNLISEIEGKFLANNENLENIELPSIEPIEEVTTVEENTEVAQEAPVESTEVVQETPVENITEEVVVASNQLDDAADEVVEAPKIEDIPAPENPISETPLIPNVENVPEESLSTTTDDKMTFKKEYDGADKSILVNESQLNKLKDSKSSQKELMDFGKKTEGTDVVLPVATAEADPRAQMEAMMAQVEEARAKNDMAKVEELLNKVSEMNSRQLVK